MYRAKQLIIIISLCGLGYWIYRELTKKPKFSGFGLIHGNVQENVQATVPAQNTNLVGNQSVSDYLSLED